jgi:hypothetical protein
MFKKNKRPLRYLPLTGTIRGTAEIRVILSISHTFISKHTCNKNFPIIFQLIIIHPNHTVGTKCFQ